MTCTVSPLLFTWLLPSTGPETRQGVIVLGTDQLAELLGGRLRQDGEPVTFLGTDEPQLEHLRRTGFQVVRGSPAYEQTLAQAGAAQARALIAVSGVPETVLAVCQLAQTRFQIPTVIARADDARLVQQLQKLAVRVVQPVMAIALGLEGAFHFPAAFDMLLNKTDDVDVMDVSLRNTALAGRPLRHVQQSVFARMVAERGRIAKRYRSEGEEEAAKIRAETDKQREILLAQAYERSQRLQGEGDAAATAIYAQAYQHDPRFYVFLRTLEAYDDILTPETLLVLPGDADMFRLLSHLPSAVKPMQGQ